MKYYKIKNWDQFQSKGKRHWPWIKLYSRFLNSQDYISGSNEDRLLMIILMIMGNDQTELMRGCIQVDTKLIQSYGRLRRRPNLIKLVKSGFLVEMDDVMSTKCRPNVVLDIDIEENEQKQHLLQHESCTYL